MLIIQRNYGKLNQSKIALKNGGAIQFVPTKNTNIFKDFYSDLAGSLVRKLPNALNKFNNNSAKQYYMNIEKSSLHCITSNYAMQCWKLLNIFQLAWTHQQPLVWMEYPQNF